MIGRADREREREIERERERERDRYRTVESGSVEGKEYWLKV